MDSLSVAFLVLGIVAISVVGMVLGKHVRAKGPGVEIETGPDSLGRHQ
jgi:hypothetical protein